MKRVAILGLLAALSWAALAGAQEKQTIQQIKQVKGPQSFVDFIGSMFASSVEGQILTWAPLVVLLAMAASYCAKWGFKALDKGVGPIDYFWRQDPQRTVGAFLGAYGTIALAAFTGAFSNEAGEFVGWYNVVFNTFMAGMAADGTVNHAPRAAWTEAQRKAAGVP